MTSRMEAEAVVRIKGQGFGQARRGVQSISQSLERMQKVAAGVALGGGAVEALRRSIGRAVRLYADVEEGLVGVAKTADLSARGVAAVHPRSRGEHLPAAAAIAEPTIHLWAGTDRYGARHIWRQHGPGSVPWETLRIDDWAWVQNMIDNPHSQIAARGVGRWVVSSRVARRRPRRIGYDFVVEARAGLLVPITFYRIEASGRS